MWHVLAVLLQSHGGTRYRLRSKVIYTCTCMTHPLIICTKYGKNPPRTVHAVEQIWQDVPYFGSFIAKSWLNDMGRYRSRSKVIGTRHTLMLAIISAKYGKNPPRTVCSAERTQDATYFNSCITKSWLNYLEVWYRSRSKVVTHDTPATSYQWAFVPNMERIHPELYTERTRTYGVKPIICKLGQAPSELPTPSNSPKLGEMAVDKLGVASSWWMVAPRCLFIHCCRGWCRHGRSDYGNDYQWRHRRPLIIALWRHPVWWQRCKCSLAKILFYCHIHTSQ